MKTQPRLSAAALQFLRCPQCKSELLSAEEYCRCLNAQCQKVFPIVDGIPVLINEENSVFRLTDFTRKQDTYFDTSSGRQFRDKISDLLPGLDLNVRRGTNHRKFAELLLAKGKTPRVLVLGGAILGAGTESLLAYPSIELVETDIALGPRTGLICDAHDIPFSPETFDGVIAQAVLEHVVDPYRCVEEIHRVLKHDGLVYAETPFMQQVHGGQYDFTRFTQLGHRRLFRKFDELESGAVCGPGMALSWAYQYFLLSFTTSRSLRRVIHLFSRLTAFFLKYFDYFLIDRRGTLDAASGYYFLGRKTGNVLSDRELITLYRGAF